MWWLRFAWASALFCNLGSLAIVGTLIDTPAGTTIFPLAHALFVAALAGFGVLIGIPFSILAYKTGQSLAQRRSAILAGIICLVPFPFSGFALGIIAQYVGFDLD